MVCHCEIPRCGCITNTSSSSSQLCSRSVAWFGEGLRMLFLHRCISLSQSCAILCQMRAFQYSPSSSLPSSRRSSSRSLLTIWFSCGDTRCPSIISYFTDVPCPDRLCYFMVFKCYLLHISLVLIKAKCTR